MLAVAFKGATAYEAQLGRISFRFVHLMCGSWHWYTFFRRISIKLEQS